MSDLNLLKTFVVVAEQRGISPAASKLGLPKSTVSRHISRFEATQPNALFIRKGRGIELTPFGRQLYERTRDAVKTAVAAVSSENVRSRDGRVILHSPMIYGRGILRPLIAEYLDRNPSVSIGVTLGDRFGNAVPTLVDAIVFVGMQPSQDFESWPLKHVESRLYAAPKLFYRRKRPVRPAELKRWPLLSANCAPGESAALSFNGSDDVSALFARAKLATDEPDFLLDAAARGAGIVRIATFLAEPLVKEGRLEVVLPKYVPDRHSVYIGRSLHSQNSAATEFIGFLVRRLG